MLKVNLKISLLSLLFATNFYAQQYSGNGADITNILENVKEFSKAYISADYEALTNFYSVDGKIFPSGSDIIIGRKAIKEKWTLPKGSSIVTHKVMPKEIKIIEDYAYDYGYYEGSSTNEKGDLFPFKGKYVIVWKKNNDSWKIYLDIWNAINTAK